MPGSGGYGYTPMPPVAPPRTPQDRYDARQRGYDSRAESISDLQRRLEALQGRGSAASDPARFAERFGGRQDNLADRIAWKQAQQGYNSDRRDAITARNPNVTGPSPVELTPQQKYRADIQRRVDSARNGT